MAGGLKKNSKPPMNQPTDLQSDAIRSDIDTTRARMDETIDALGNRFDGRHIVDEVLGFFRRSDGGANRLGSQLSKSAESALSSVTSTVKENPIPVLLIGAGVAWMLFKSRQSSHDSTSNYSTADERDFNRSHPREYTDQPLQQKAGSMAAQAKDKLSDLGSQARDKLSDMGDRGRETFDSVRNRAGEIGQQVQQRGREIYSQTRERVVSTAQQHPLEVGLGCLAIGLIAGLALPTPERVHRSLGPTVDRLRTRTREVGADYLEKGKKVAQAAAAAAKEAAQSQGLTLDRFKEQVGAVANKASDAASSTARNEGLPMPGGQNQPASGSGQQPGNSPGASA
jgi:ElaB/YqjD/DUF883 family membrane-anchored ribosome-binding protein